MVSARVPGGAGGVLVRNSIPGAFWHASNTEQAALFSPNQLILLGRNRIRRGLRPEVLGAALARAGAISPQLLLQSADEVLVA
jgi:hypothetical protein